MANKLNIKSILEEEIKKIGLGWDIKGVIDSKNRIYTINSDTKLISKVFELVTTPIIVDIAEKYEIKVVSSNRQTFYPDLTLILPTGEKIALDIKSTYRKTKDKVAGLTLGSYTGYLRNPIKNIMFPYHEYVEHWVLAFIYTREDDKDGEIIPLSKIDEIVPVIKDIEIIMQEKYKLSADRPGSGNTANIGSSSDIETLRKGTGVFAKHGEKVFEDYWRNFLQRKIARDMRKVQPYHNLVEYLAWKKKQK